MAYSMEETEIKIELLSNNLLQYLVFLFRGSTEKEQLFIPPKGDEQGRIVKLYTYSQFNCMLTHFIPLEKKRNKDKNSLKE